MKIMQERTTLLAASIALILGGMLGLAGSFAPTTSLRGIAWGIDGVSLIVAASLLTIYYLRKGLDTTAAGFMIFAIGESLILASGANLDEQTSVFGAGTSLWSASLFIISLQKTFPLFIRITGIIAAILFGITSIMIFNCDCVNALTKPLPFNAYPVFVITMFGWAWILLNSR